MPFGGDEAVYHELASRLLAGKGFTLAQGQPTAWRTPGFPLVLAGIYAVVGEDPLLARRALVFLTSLTAPLLFVFTLMLFRRMSVALLAGFYWAVLPTSVRLSGLFLGESSAALIFTLAMVFLLIAERRRPVIWLSGALFGFAILVRGYMIPAAAAPIIWLLVRRQWRPAFIVAISVALVIGAWATRNVLTLGVFTVSTEAAELTWLGNNQWARGTYSGDWVPQLAHLEVLYPGFHSFDEVARARVFRTEGIREIIGNPGRFFWLLPRKAAIFLSPRHLWLGTDLVYFVLLPFWLFGAYTLWTSRQLNLWLLGVPLVGLLLLCIVIFGDSRFRHPIEPMIAALGAFGFMTFLGRLYHRGGEKGSAVYHD